MEINQILENIGKICVCEKTTGKQFIAKFVGIENEYLVFVAKDGVRRKNRIGDISTMMAVA